MVADARIYSGRQNNVRFLSLEHDYLILFASLSVDTNSPFVYRNPLCIDPLFQLHVRLRIQAPGAIVKSKLDRNQYHEYCETESAPQAIRG